MSCDDRKAEEPQGVTARWNWKSIWKILAFCHPPPVTAQTIQIASLHLVSDQENKPRFPSTPLTVSVIAGAPTCRYPTLRGLEL